MSLIDHCVLSKSSESKSNTYFENNWILSFHWSVLLICFELWTFLTSLSVWLCRTLMQSSRPLQHWKQIIVTENKNTKNMCRGEQGIKHWTIVTHNCLKVSTLINTTLRKFSFFIIEHLFYHSKVKFLTEVKKIQ